MWINPAALLHLNHCIAFQRRKMSPKDGWISYLVICLSCRDHTTQHSCLSQQTPCQIKHLQWHKFLPCRGQETGNSTGMKSQSSFTALREFIGHQGGRTINCQSGAPRSSSYLTDASLTATECQQAAARWHMLPSWLWCSGVKHAPLPEDGWLEYCCHSLTNRSSLSLFCLTTASLFLFISF